MSDQLTFGIKVRSILFWVIAVGVLPICAIYALLVMLLPRKIRHLMMIQWSRFYTLLMKHLCGINYRVQGIENIPIEPAIYAGNHQSAWETMALTKILPQFVWVMKRELLKVPLFGWAVAAASPIAIDRSKGVDSMEQIIRQGTERFGAGLGITIFPEGTRIKPKSRKEFKIGVAKLAIGLNKPIVPFAHNSGYFFKKGGFWLYPGTVDVVIGKPIYPDNDDPAEFIQKIQAWVYSELDKLGS